MPSTTQVKKLIEDATIVINVAGALIPPLIAAIKLLQNGDELSNLDLIEKLERNRLEVEKLKAQFLDEN